MRRPLAVLLFLASVIAFTFVSTVVHEVGHAVAWDASEPPTFIAAQSRDEARGVVASEKSMHIDGKAYRVMEVERTTIALYPKTILITGATLGIAPGVLLSDHVLASTFYALDEDDYARLAAGQEVTGWQEAAMPMIINGFIAIPVWIWLLWRPHAVSMAAAWSNATEWRFNVHHATEVGIPEGVYMGLSLLIMAITAGAITFLACGGRGPVHGIPVRPGPVAQRGPHVVRGTRRLKTGSMQAASPKRQPGPAPGNQVARANQRAASYQAPTRSATSPAPAPRSRGNQI